MITYSKTVVIDAPPQSIGTKHGRLIQSYVLDDIKDNLPAHDKVIRFIVQPAPDKKRCVGVATIERKETTQCLPMYLT